MENIIAQMAQEVSKQVTCCFVDHDFNLDQQELRRARSEGWAGREFIWILRDSGTQLVEACIGNNPDRVSFWTEHAKRERKSYRYFQIHGDKLKEISAIQALTLINQPPRLPMAPSREDAVNALLERFQVDGFTTRPPVDQAHRNNWLELLKRSQNRFAAKVALLIS